MAGSPTKSDYSRADVLRLARVTPRQLASWERLGLFEPSDTYGFQQVVALRTLASLKAKHLPANKIRQALDALRARLSEIRDPLAELKIVVEGRKIQVQLSGQRLEPVSGQFVLDFDRSTAERTVSLPAPDDNEAAAAERRRKKEAEHWFLKGVDLEQTGGAFEEITDAYRIAVSLDPQFAPALVNLGTVYYTARDLERAEKYYARAIEANPNYPLAQFNMANLWDERGVRSRALTYYLKALELDPHYADAHYNLALLHQAQGEVMKALRHWKLYLKLDGSSQWADVARREMNKLMATTVLRGRVTGDTA